MVYNSQELNVQSGEMLWDFRQFYTEWVRVYMAHFSHHHLKGNYPEMFFFLKKWHSVIWGRALREFEIGKSIDKEFKKLIGIIETLSNDAKYKKTYFGKDKDPEAVDKLDESFDSVVVYLVWLMKKNKFFGSETINRGLT